jgi:hypothetical protein
MTTSETPIASATPAAPERKAGRAKKANKDSATRVVAALSAHHGYGKQTDITNFEPATDRLLAETYGLANNALSRFLAGPEGRQKYKNACRNRTVGGLLAFWNRELPDLRISLPFDDAELASEEDDD